MKRDIENKADTTRNDEEVDIIFKNLKYTIQTKKGKKELVKGVDGICKSGQVTAILGSSGAGKTTLLNILCKRISNSKKGTLEGEILANNNHYNSDQFSQFATYVMQDDILLETMTVRECLQFAANLKTNGSIKEKHLKVDNMIRSLRLDKCQNTFIGGLFVKGISGGERKRTSIGYELISSPSCIFLDEPTSGLDSFTAYSIIHLLKKYAHYHHKTVVFTIHQPSSDIWNMFDTVMLMVEGQFIYQGKGGINVVNYFTSIGFQCPIYSNPSGDIPKRKTITTKFYQTSQIAKRQVHIIKRNPLLSKARLGQSVIIALFIGLIYLNTPGPNDNPTQRDVGDKNGVLFFFSVSMFMMQLNPCILTFPSQRAVFLREENAKLYTIGPYFIGKLIIDVIPAIIFPTISVLIAYWMIGLNNDNAGKVFFFILIAILQSLCGLGFGYFGGSAFSDARLAISITPLMIMPFMLFAGFYKNAADYASWIGWIQYLSPFKYAFTALADNEYTYEGKGYPQDPLKQLNFDLSKWDSVGCQVALFFASIIISFIFLLSLKKRVQ